MEKGKDMGSISEHDYSIPLSLISLSGGELMEERRKERSNKHSDTYMTSPRLS